MMSEDIEVNESTVHTVLNYCITQAVVNKKSYKSKLQIPYEALKQSNKLDHESEYPGTALEVTMSFKWVEHTDSESVEVVNE